MNACQHVASGFAAWFALLSVCFTSLPAFAEVPTPTVVATAAEVPLTHTAQRATELLGLSQAFERKAQEFIAQYYDFRLGLRGEAPPHSVLRTVLIEFQGGLQSLPDSTLKSFLLQKLATAHGLENDGQLRRAVNELVFCISGLPRLEVDDADDLPRQDILVEEPWRQIRPAELVINCNAQRLLASLQADSTPDHSKQGLDVHRRLADASALIMDETLDNNEGDTKAELIEIEEAAVWSEQQAAVEKHPVVVFRIRKTFLDKFDWDENGSPKRKTFEFLMRQRVQTFRDERGQVTEHVVTNEMLDPVLAGGNPTKGQFGLHYYKTVLSVRPVADDENKTLVQFRVLSVPDFRGRLAKSRVRQAVSIFLNLENRRLTSRTMERIAEHWPPRASNSDWVVSAE